MIIASLSYLSLEYDETMGCILQRWRGYITPEQFRHGVDLTNKLFKEKAPVSKFVVELTFALRVKREDTDWAAREAIPIAKRHGLKYYGFSVPEDIYTQVTYNNFVSELSSIDPEIEMKLFRTIEETIMWIKTK